MSDVASPQNHIWETHFPVMSRADAPVGLTVKKQDGYLNPGRGRTVVPEIFRKRPELAAEIVIEIGNFLKRPVHLRIAFRRSIKYLPSQFLLLELAGGYR